LREVYLSFDDDRPVAVGGYSQPVAPEQELQRAAPVGEVASEQIR
jgi:hypothetical protein